jgi:hypothetical protein
MFASYPATEAHLERARFRAAYTELERALKGVRSDDPSWYTVHIGHARESQLF